MNRVTLSEMTSDLLRQAIDISVKAMEDGEVPFFPHAMEVVTGENGQPRWNLVMLSQLGMDSPGALAHAQQSMRPGRSLLAYAIAWDGFVTAEGQRTDAILVEVGDLNGSYVMSQRYAVAKRWTGRIRVTLIDEPRLVDTRPATRLATPIEG